MQAEKWDAGAIERTISPTNLQPASMSVCGTAVSCESARGFGYGYIGDLPVLVEGNEKLRIGYRRRGARWNFRLQTQKDPSWGGILEKTQLEADYGVVLTVLTARLSADGAGAATKKL